MVVGVAASLHDWRPEQFTRFLGWWDAGHDGESLALRVNHEPHRYTPGGVVAADVGVCRQFASVPAGGAFPGGLVVLGELYTERAPHILADMRYRDGWGAMSVSGVRERGDLWVVEVSLCRRGEQADEGALVLGAGREAASVWELLTGQPAAVGAVGEA